MPQQAGIYRFGPFCLDRGAYRLLNGDVPLSLAPKVIDLLFLLVSRPSSLVTKEDILQALWPDVAVTDNAITQVVSDLRQALGDSSATPQYVQTVPRRGYRFVAAVEAVDLAPAAAARPAPSATEARARGPRTVAVMDFTNVTRDSSVDWLAAGIAETVTNDLRAIRDLAVIDRALVSEAARHASADTADPPAGIDLLVVGSYQRSGDQLRITARAVDVRTREALAHAKADGPLADVFQLQDVVVTQLSAGLQLTITPAAAARIRARETSNLDAYRAFSEGRLKLETLEAAQVPAAIKDFEKALELDPRYALAHVGLAHARFWRFQASRASNRPAVEELKAAVAHARKAVEIDAELAEAHSALAFFLASAERSAEAVAAGRLATALEPGNWRHQFRLGTAAWGTERIAALQAVVSTFPQLSYAYFGMAMVHVARGDLGLAESVLRQGITFERPGAGRAERFPGSGLHWLLGLTRLASGDVDEARREFDRELALASGGIFADEFAMDAFDGHGFALIDAGDLRGAAAMFKRALERYPEHARSWLGLAAVHARQRRHKDAAAATTRALKAIDELRTNGRNTEAAMAAAFAQVQSGRATDACATLGRLLAEAPPGFAGWTLPVEPVLASLRGEPSFRALLGTLAERAR
jgi:DNA-binding winged helix-turn-helix (wHTH) protein/tetratricopeptide (TPR) repeat protein